MMVLWVILNKFHRSTTVTMQPVNTYHFKNTFGLLNGENIIKIYECREGCSKCCGPKTTIALTTNRIISRTKQSNRCFGCIKGAYVDTTIFLRDIEVISKAKTTWISWLIIFIAIITCTWPFLLLFLRCSCCGDRPKTLAVKGGFGSELLTFKQSDVPSAANDISAMVLPFKTLVSTHKAMLVEAFWSVTVSH